MNIVIIGGGRPQHFGNDLALRAEQQGHDVRILSHKDYGVNNPKHLYADMDRSNQPAIDTFQRLTADLTHIDLFLYNTVSGAGPWNEQDFTTQSRRIPERDWLYNLRINVILPYELTLLALAKMNNQSKIVYMTTGRSYNMQDDNPPFIASYYGAKAWANHVMKSFAHYNDRGASAVSVTSHFDYSNPEAYKPVFDRAYDYIVNSQDHHKSNGRVITIQ